MSEAIAAGADPDHRGATDEPETDATDADVDRAATAGAARARALVRDHGTDDPWALADALGVDVTTDRWAGVGSTALLGTYSDGRVTLYDRQIERFAARVDRPEARVRRVALAHELGHHLLDGTRLADASDSLAWRALAALSLVPASPRARECEERAARAFAETLTGIAIDRRPPTDDRDSPRSEMQDTTERSDSNA